MPEEQRMTGTIGRRHFLGAALSAVAAAALGDMARAASSSRKGTPLSAIALDEKLLLVQGAGGNVVISAHGDGLVLIDSGASTHTKALLRLIQERFGHTRIETLINTHWHLDHTGGNDTLGKRGVRIIAHENTRLWMQAEFHSEWEGHTYPPRAKYAVPTETTYTSGEVTAGRERIQYVHLPQAHTDGDLYVFFPESNVLVAGDLLAVGTYPIVDYATGAWIGGFIAANEALVRATDVQTRIIPGSGPIQTRADLEAQLTMCATVKERLHQSFKSGNSLEEFIATQPTREFDAKWGDPRQFLAMIYESAMGHIFEMGGGIV